jgi:hypothetical protein
MPEIDFVRAEIEHMRVQVHRQRKEIVQLQRAGIATASAELLLGRMHAKIDSLCAERERRNVPVRSPSYRFQPRGDEGCGRTAEPARFPPPAFVCLP